LKRLGAGEWFTARVSACGLFHIAYPSAREALRLDLRSLYNQLCRDDLPMVRRSAASNLGKFAATVEPLFLKSEILSFFRELTQDGIYYLLECPFLILKFVFIMILLVLVLPYAVWLTLLFIAVQDSVRILAVEGCAALGKLLEPQDCVENILPVIISFSQVCVCM
jgi:serine/threonine-protein phosphatase 2A regulatory subunit A